MSNSKGKCTNCGKYYPRESMKIVPAGKFCKIDCLLDYANNSTDKLLKTARKLTKKQDNLRKKKAKPKSKWLSELQTLVNKYVRLRDIKDGCISCDKPASWAGQWHASHYYSRGHSSSLRFNLNNIHKSCSVCNSHLSGNIEQYRPRIIEKIGKDKLDNLTRRKSDIRPYSVEWIERAIKVTRKAIKRVQ